ncbi:MAG: ABC transporter permease subunit [candidate division Zixibacteria bacterium]|nr:ABC transporter permease subunit [candidate division Zixibacteria bacterium]
MSKSDTRGARRDWSGVVLSLPWTIVLGVFWLYPLVYALVLAFARRDVFSGEWTWVGLANFAAVLQNSDFWSALGHTVFFAAGTVPVTTAIAIIVALALNRRIWGRTLFRAGFFAPTLTATVVVALVFLQLYGQNGYLYRLAQMIGLPVPEQGFLLSESTALLAVMVMDIWVSIGYYTLLFLAGLQTIPQDLIDDALTHGANAWQRFWAITWPYLRPMLLYAVVINLIKSFQIFTEIFVMTQGGPVGSTTTVVYHVYTTGFERFDMGYASAAAYLLFIVIALIALVQFRLLSFGRGAEE